MKTAIMGVSGFDSSFGGVATMILISGGATSGSPSFRLAEANERYLDGCCDGGWVLDCGFLPLGCSTGSLGGDGSLDGS